MAPSSSSTRRAARLAQKGKGKRVRFQGGTLFPLVVAIVLVLGFALIVYARTSRPAADASAPQPGIDHWHIAYGFQVCSDTPNIQLTGNLEETDANGNLVSSAFRLTGVHSHDDGVIHWHPYGSKASGRNARLGVFLDNYNVKLDDTTLELPTEPGAFTVDGAAPPENFPTTYEEGETECGGEEAHLRAVVWDNFGDPGSSHKYASNFEDIRIERDGMVIVIAFVPDNVDIVMPTWAADLPTLGAVDSGAVPTTLAPGETAPEGTATETTTEGTEPGGTDGSGTTEAGATATETTEATDTTSEPETTEASGDITEGSDTTESADTTEG